MEKNDKIEHNKGKRSDIRESYVQHEENQYRLLFVRMYRSVLDILLFYLAWLLFRYGRLFGMSGYGFRYNYFVTIGYAFLLYWFKKTYNANLFGYAKESGIIGTTMRKVVISVVSEKSKTGLSSIFG